MQPPMFTHCCVFLADGGPTPLSSIELHLRLGSDLLQLRRYYHMPGSISVIEACMRDVQQPKSTYQLCDAMHRTAATILLSCGSDHEDMVPTCVSLAATLRKLMQSLIKPYAGTSVDRKEQEQLQLRRQHLPLIEQQRLTNLQEKDTQVNMRIPPLTQRYGETIAALNALRLRQPSSPVLITDGSSPEPVSPPRLDRAHGIHQLQSIMLSSWTHMNHYWLGCARDVGMLGTPSWVEMGLVRLGGLGMGMLEVAQAQLHGPLLSTTQLQGRVDAVWEGYALTHFNGRLVPGCCYLGCSNLCGTSEAALRTQLCGGCRKARYCSRKCQQAAWRDGGHHAVCSSTRTSSN